MKLWSIRFTAGALIAAVSVIGLWTQVPAAVAQAAYRLCDAEVMVASVSADRESMEDHGYLVEFVDDKVLVYASVRGPGGTSLYLVQLVDPVSGLPVASGSLTGHDTLVDTVCRVYGQALADPQNAIEALGRLLTAEPWERR